MPSSQNPLAEFLISLANPRNLRAYRQNPNAYLHRFGVSAADRKTLDRYGKNKNGAAHARVTLVDRHPTHIWKPLLHEVAAGSMDPFTQELEYAAQARWHGFEFQQGELAGLDRKAKKIMLAPVLADFDAGRDLPEIEEAEKLLRHGH